MEFNLSEKRMELYRKMCDLFPDFKWGLLFEDISNQDKEAVRLLKEEMPSEVICQQCDNNFSPWNIIDKIFGEKLI